MTEGDVMDGMMMISHNITDNMTNCTEIVEEVDYSRGISLLVIAIIALFGNIMTILVLFKFKIKKIPDLLVMALAADDLIATLIPINMSIISYFRGKNYREDSVECAFFGVISIYTRFTASLIVTVISIERFLAVKRPLFYRKHCTLSLFKKILVAVFVFNAILAFPPAVDPNTPINEYQGYCLFSYPRVYAIFIAIYTLLQSAIVLFCFVCIVIELYRLHRRRHKMTAQSNYNKYSSAMHRDNNNVTFSKPGLASTVSDLGNKIKKVAPAVGEWLQLSIEAQFARMLLAVTILFYISWMPTVIVMLYTMGKEGIILDPKIPKCLESEINQVFLFWTVRATVISTAFNPLLYGFLAKQYRTAYKYLLRLFFSKCCSCVDPPQDNIFLQDRKNNGQTNRDDNVKQINFRKIATFRQRYFNNTFMNGNPNATSSPLADSPINYSLPDLTQEDEPPLSNLHSTIIDTEEPSQPNRTAKLSASMGEYLDDISQNMLQVTSNPLHSSTESDLNMGAYTNKAILDDSFDVREQLPSNGNVKTGHGTETNGTESSKQSNDEDNTFNIRLTV